MPKVIVLIFLFLLYTACYSTPESDLVSEHIKELEHLTVYPVDAEPVLEIQLVREQVFDSSEVLIGSMGDMAVDESGRVFIADQSRQAIHVFAPDGRYLTSMGREGRGPGEFRRLSSLRVIKNQLFAVENIRQQGNIFSLDTFAFSHTVSLHPENQDDFEELAELNPAQYFIKRDGTFLVSFQPMLVQFPHHPKYNLDDISKRSIHYHPISSGGIISDKVLEQDGMQFLTATINGKFEWAFNFLFTDKPLIAISDDNHLFSARTEEFLVTAYAPDGKYLYAFYYPYQRVRLTRQAALESDTVNEYHKNIIQHAELPDRWPALHSMLVDDQNRLWVATIVDDLEVFQWWVLETSGELLARFTWPRERHIEVVKHGYLYVRKTDEETGVQQIVRYQTTMTSR